MITLDGAEIVLSVMRLLVLSEILIPTLRGRGTRDNKDKQL